MWKRGAAALLAPVAVATAVGCAPGTTEEAGYTWNLPEGFPAPVVPADNPMSAAKAELGRHLFYDVRLSSTATTSCATCHAQDKAFTDGEVFSEGEAGDLLPRNSMGLTNVAYNSVQTWANPALLTLEDHAMVPLFAEFPIELGWAEGEATVLARLRGIEGYPALFEAAFPDAETHVTRQQVVHAIAAFERTMLSVNSPYDKRQRGETDAMSPAALRGQALFFSERLECFHCHGGFNFTDAYDHNGSVVAEVAYHNTGLYNVDGAGGFPAADRGLYDITGEPRDMGRFRAPTLRNVAVTGPFMHDGSIATLSEVIDHYAAGGRTIADGPHAGIGADNPYKSTFVSGFVLTADEKDDLLAFLNALTDPDFLSDPALSDPFEQGDAMVAPPAEGGE